MHKLKRKFLRRKKPSRNESNPHVQTVKTAWLLVFDKLTENESFTRRNVVRLTINEKATNFFQSKKKGDCDEFVSKTRNFIA